MLEEVIEKAIKTVKEGGVILYPSDTIWGLGCHAMHPEAIEKIHKINGGSSQDDLILLIDSEKRLEQYVANPPLKAFNLIKHYEKPLTILYTETMDLPETVKHKDGRVAIRVVDDAFCRFMIKALQQPLVFIPANGSEEGFPGNFEEIEESLRSAVDYVVPFKQDIQETSSVSKMIRFNADNEIEVLRD